MKKKTMHKLKKTKVSEKKLSESCDIEYMEKEVYNKPESEVYYIEQESIIMIEKTIDLTTVDKSNVAIE